MAASIAERPAEGFDGRREADAGVGAADYDWNAHLHPIVRSQVSMAQAQRHWRSHTSRLQPLQPS